jgi:hypothetical protein
MWTCPKCRAKVDDSFVICWSCGTSPEGVEDPAFAHADDVGPVPDLPCKGDDQVVDDLDLGVAEPEIEVVACYWAGEPYEARFLADQLLLEGIPATADSWDLRIVFAGLFGFVPAGPYFGPRVRVLAEDLPRARAWIAGYEQRRRAKRRRHHDEPSGELFLPRSE